MATLNEQFKTAYQTLSDILSPFKSKLTTPVEIPQEILNANSNTNNPNPNSSVEEIQKIAMQNAQQAYFNNTNLKVFSQAREKKMIYETSRISQYYDYEAMDLDCRIGAALNLMSEEATTKGDDGKVLHIYSEDKRVKKELERLFYNVLEVNTTLAFWARNLIKYGDNFIYLLLALGKGITGAMQLPNLNIERLDEEKDGEIVTKFINRDKNMQYANYQIGHFRLLGDDKRLPYGMSILDKVRRTWKMLTMAEDGWLVYIISRVAERRIYNVSVGNSPAEDIPNILQAVASQVKKSPLIDPNTGDINFKYSIATQDADIFVPRRVGETGNAIDTLPGAQNIDKIEYLSYLENIMYTGLETPKMFLSFSSESGMEGGGRNLSMIDIRFAKKINKIQQALVSELNKFAIIHLHLLGGDFAKNLDNFTLTLTNPSTQADMLKTELLTQKLDLYAKATTPSDTGIKPMSEAKAKMDILGWSLDDIHSDLLDQIMELKIGDEIRSGGELIKSSKLYDKLIGVFSTSSETTSGENSAGDATGGDDIGIDQATSEPTPSTDIPSAEPIREKFILESNNNVRTNKLDKLIEGLDKEFVEKKKDIIHKTVKKNLTPEIKVKLLDLGYTMEDINKTPTPTLVKYANKNIAKKN
jgi:hypothetical protein